jgi:subtilisin family serine protease
VRRAWPPLAAALATGLALAAPASAQGPGAAVIVQVRPSATALVPVAPSHVASLLRRRAERDQGALLRMLRAAERRGEASGVESLWIRDAIALRARPELIARLRRRADVLAVGPDRTLRIRPAALAAAALPAANAAATGAPELWAQGHTGRGAVVAVLDTGLAAGFPQFAGRKGSWFDPYDQHPAPFDEDARGHGTEVAEVVVSMAPDVRIIAARVFSDGGRSTTSAVHRVFEWVLDPDGNPRTDDAPSVVNGSWDDGGPGRCETEFDADLAALRAAGVVPVFAAGNAGPGASTGASPASAPGAVAVASVSSTDVVSPFSGRGPSTCSNAIFPTLAAYGEEIALAGPGGATVVSGTSFAAPQVAGAVALLAAMFPGATPAAVVDALVRGARDVGAPGADTETGAGVVNVAQAAALLAGADHAGPSVTIGARWSTESARPGLLLVGRAQERGGGTSDGIAAMAFISSRGVPTAPFALSATPLDAGSAALTGTITRRQFRRLADGRHRLFVRARDASGNWGPARAVVLPVDRTSPGLRASGSRRGDIISALLHVRERGSGVVSLRYRVEVGGRLGRWRALAPAAQVRLALHAKRGKRAVLRVHATDLAGNETRSGFVLPR